MTNLRADRSWALALVAAAALIAVGHGLSFGVCPQDDAFISLRYARNLVSGQGLVFNPGERVEGFTNFLWTLLCAIPFALGVDPLAFLRVIGLACGIGAVLAAALLARAVAPQAPAAAGAAAILVAALPFLAAESVMGLETVAFAGLAAAGVALFIRENRGGAPPARFPWSGMALGLAALTRPEGVLIAGIVFLFDGVRALRTRRIGAARWGRWSIVAACVLGQLAFRLAYYGDPLPNTFYAKVGGGMAALLRGAGYTIDFVAATFPLLALAAFGIWACRRFGAQRGEVALVAVAAALFVAYVTYVGGDYKPTFRFFAVPAVLAAAPAGAAAEWLAARGRAAPLWRVLALTACAGLLFALGGPARDFARWRADETPVHLAAGRWLKANFPPQTLVATSNAGAVPYASDLPTLDMLGLCDRRIAHRPVGAMGEGMAGHEKGDGQYVLDRRPRVILFQLTRFSDGPLAAAQASRPLWLGERELSGDQRFLQEYQVRSARLPGFYFNFFERKMTP